MADSRKHFSTGHAIYGGEPVADDLDKSENLLTD